MFNPKYERVNTNSDSSRATMEQTVSIKMQQTKSHTLNEDTEKEKNWFQILAIFLASLHGLSFGLLMAWPSPSIPKITNDTITYNITLSEASYFTVLPCIGMIFGSLVSGKITDFIGRKNSLLLICIPHLVSWLLIASARSVYVFYLARFISGCADALIFSAVPTYVGEVSTPKVRGSWGNLMTVLIMCAQCLVNVIGAFTSIATSAYICMLVPIVFFCTFIFMPESPYFLLMKGRVEDARLSLQRLRRKDNVDEELFRLDGAMKRQMAESGTWRDLFIITSNRNAVYAGLFMRIAQQLSGFPAFVIYAQYIFKQAGSSLSASSSAIIFTALNSIVNIISSSILDRFGRKKVFFLSALSAFFVLVLETTYFSLKQFRPQLDLSDFKWVPLAGMILFVISFGFGMSIIPNLMLGELFSSSIKSKALCLMNIVFAMFLASVTKLFHLLETEYGLFAPFLFFATCTLFSAIFSLKIVPETSGKTLEEIQQSLKEKKSKGEST